MLIVHAASPGADIDIVDLVPTAIAPLPDTTEVAALAACDHINTALTGFQFPP